MGMTLAFEVGTPNFKANSDSKLVKNKVNMEYHTKEPYLVKYLKKVSDLSRRFKAFNIVYVPKD